MLGTRRPARAVALLLLSLAGACGTTQLTPQQEWVMDLFAECKTRTNAINVKLEQVYPDGRWSASSMQTQSDFNRVGECMQDDTVSASLYRRQVEGGNAAAMANLGSMYEDGRGGLAKSDAEAVQWYRRGAEAGSGQAMASLGTMYERGRGGLAKNADEAAQWYRKGADRSIRDVLPGPRARVRGRRHAGPRRSCAVVSQGRRQGIHAGRPTLEDARSVGSPRRTWRT